MLKRKLVLQIVFVLFSAITFSQSKKLWTEIADDAFAKKDYATAAVNYAKVLDDTTVLRSYVLPYETQLVNLQSKALFKVPELRVTKRKDSTNIVKETLVNSSKYDFIMYRLATSYRLNFDYKHAVDQYKKCVDRKVYPDAPYYYGVSLMSLRKYSDALKVFDNYINPKPDSANVMPKPGTDSLVKLAAKKQKSCYFGLDTLSPRKPIKVKMMDSLVFNRGTSSFAPMYFENDSKILFTSARKGGVVTDPEKQDSRYFCDVYTSTVDDTIWQRPVNFGRPVNTSLHEGAAYFSKDGVMLFTRWSDNNKNESFIYMARSIEGKFYDAMKLGTSVNLPGYKSQQPFMSNDGTKLFFSSNRPGGKGGFDLWMAPIDGNGFIGEAQNLKEPINTAGDEITPFFHDLASTLFYSTNGMPGLGGFDIHKASLNADDSVYQYPVNLNAPINSSKDDAYYVMDRLGEKGFFASDREDCPSGHCYDIYSYINAPIFFNLSGYVYDFETNDPIPSALVTVKDVHDGEEPFFLVTDAKGYYETPLKPNLEFFLKAQKNKYFGQAASVATKGKTESEAFTQDFFLSKIPEGDIEIEGVEYDFNSFTLRPKSKEILDKIVEILKVNDNLSIELSSHTDARGNDAYNLKLSQGRAQSCVDYIIEKGIAKKRIQATGYGETKPIILEEEINKMVPKSEEFEIAHQKNRRTAFRVIGESNINIINKTK
jgi:outer membrane protein OmpA-like peptidoglycan-associated protein/Tol biopolymer transport system component